MRKLTKNELVVLINRFDTITMIVHGPSVAHISLIGSEEDVLLLDAHLMRKNEKKKPTLVEDLRNAKRWNWDGAKAANEIERLQSVIDCRLNAWSNLVE